MNKFWFLLSLVILVSLGTAAIIRGDYLYLIVVSFLVISQLILSYFKLLSREFFILFPFLAIFYLVGDLLGHYERGTEYDAVLHFFSGFIVSLLFGSVLLKITKIAREKMTFVLVLIAFGLVIGIGWELFEWWAGQFFPEDLVGDIDDTASDIVADTLGTFLAGYILTKYFEYFSKK